MAVSDIKFSQRLAFILESISVTIILILCIAVYVHNGGVFDAHQLTLKGSSGGGIVVGMVLAIFAFVGFESAGALGQEAKNPARSVPRAIIWSCAIIGVFYLIVAYTQVYGFGDAAFGNATAPLPQLASRVGLGWLGHFIAIGITCSMFACALACLTAGSRMLLSLGHDGLLPTVFTHTTKRTHAPGVAIWSVAIPMTVVPVAYILAGSTDTTLTGEEGTIATYGFMLAYGLVCLAMPIYLRKIGENKPLAWVLGLLGAVTMVFVFYVNWIPTVIPNHIFAALTWPWWTFPYVFLAWTALGLIAYLYVKMRKPEVIHAAGTWGDATDPNAAAEEEAAKTASLTQGRRRTRAGGLARDGVQRLPGRPRRVDRLGRGGDPLVGPLGLVRQPVEEDLVADLVLRAERPRRVGARGQPGDSRSVISRDDRADQFPGGLPEFSTCADGSSPLLYHLAW